jgi:hypothetical protein
VGLTGMVGFNHHRGSALTGDPASEEEHDAEVAGDEHADHDHADTAVSGTVDEGLRTSIIAGFDLTLNWEPPNRSKYYYFTFRTEGLYIRKELADNQVLQWLGGYSSLEFKVSRRWILGFRGDLVQEFTSENQFAQLDRWEWQVAPYVTWWQSPWVRFRLEYDFHESLQGALDHRVLIQLTFAAGPHKHERY